MTIVDGIPILISVGALWLAYESYRFAKSTQGRNERLVSAQQLTDLKVESFRAVQTIEKGIEVLEDVERRFFHLSTVSETDVEAVISQVTTLLDTARENREVLAAERQKYYSLPFDLQPSEFEPSKAIVRELLLTSEWIREKAGTLLTMMDELEAKARNGTWELDRVLAAMRDQITKDDPNAG